MQSEDVHVYRCFPPEQKGAASHYRAWTLAGLGKHINNIVRLPQPYNSPQH